MDKNTLHRIQISESIGSVSMLMRVPEKAEAVLVLAHGAGAGMNHPFMELLSDELAGHAISVVRFNFPYMENKKNRPDPAPVAEKTVAVIVEFVHKSFPELPLFAGGKSFGGRMTSQRLSKECPPFVKGIIFFGFPLHPIGAPSVERAKHLQTIHIPLLFIQGTRDKMAELELLRETCSGLPTASLITLSGADHSFKSGKLNLIPELAGYAASWIDNKAKN